MPAARRKPLRLTLQRLEAREVPAALAWTPVNDPGVGGHVSSLSVSPFDSNRVLAGGDMLGIALSTDGGATWQQTSGLESRSGYHDEEFTWVTASTVWAATSTGPFLSTDGGRTWSLRRAGFPEDSFNVPYDTSANANWGRIAAPVQKILVDPNNASRVLAFTGNHRRFYSDSWWGNGSLPTYKNLGEVWESTNGGANWSFKSTLAAGRHVEQALYRPGSGDTVYAVTDDGFYSSTNDGGQWQKVGTGLPAGGVRWFTVSPSNANHVWVSTGRQGVWKSENGGTSFSQVSAGLVTGRGWGDKVEVDRDANDGTETLFYAYSDDGQNGGGGRGLYRSVNGGAWARASSFGASAYPFYENMTALVYDPSNRNRLFAATQSTIWRSTDGGVNWSDVSSTSLGNGAWRGTGYSGQVTTNFKWNPWNTAESAALGLDDGRWFSRDNLSSWKYAGSGGGIDRWFGTQDVAFTNTSGASEVVYLTRGQFGGYGAGVYRTGNGGTNWSRLADPPGLTRDGGGNLVNHPTNVYAHKTETNRVWVVWDGKLFYSSTSGGSWTRVATAAGTVKTMTGDWRAANGTTVVLGTNTGVWRSTDGTNFSQVGASGTPTEVVWAAADPHTAGGLYVVSDNVGVHRWNGSAWSTLRTDDTVAAVDVDPSRAGRIVFTSDMDPFVGDTNESGVWVGELNGGSWSFAQHNAGLAMWRVSTVTFNPNGSGELVVGTNGRGFYKASFAQGTGSVTREFWSNVTGTAIGNIPTGSAPSGTGTLTSLEGPTNWADNYGTRIRGYITAPATGSYTFWVAGDDSSELRLSTSASAANPPVIASVNGWTNSREWNKYASQKSAAVNLVAGQRYFFQVLHKEGGGGDNIAVGWSRPGQSTAAPSEVVPGSVLSPYFANLVTNGTFEANTGQSPAGWSEWSDTGSEGASFVETTGGGGGPYAGTSKGTHWSAGNYRVYTYQWLTGLANGTYTLRAYARRGGGANAARMEVKNYGGGQVNRDIPESASYQLLEITGINVTNGQCEIGFWSDAYGGTYSFFDNVEFVRTA